MFLWQSASSLHVSRTSTHGWVCADSDWTRRRRSCCGCVRVSCWTRSTAMTSWCSARASPSRTPSRPRCCHRPWAVAGGPCHGRLSLRLQPATPVTTSSPLVDRECHHDACPGVHLVWPGLLQLTAVWHQRRTISTPPDCLSVCLSIYLSN